LGILSGNSGGGDMGSKGSHDLANTPASLLTNLMKICIGISASIDALHQRSFIFQLVALNSPEENLSP
jgi:hypothetical protein